MGIISNGVAMEWLIQTLGAKLCCIISSSVGGSVNVLVKRQFDWMGLKGVGIAIIVGIIAAEWFIPPIMKHWELDMTWGPAMAFVIGYCGIRLLPAIDYRLKKVIKDG